MMKPPVTLDESQRRTLTQWARSRTVSVRWRERARIVLAASKGDSDQAIAEALGTTRHRVARWRARFASGGVAALKQDLPRGGRPPKADATKIEEIIRLTIQTTPAHATHWSTRSMAARVGVSDSTVLRIWHAHGLKPHRVETFKLSNDPQFAEKLDAIVGLYLSPPEHALVLCCDEKSQGQALDRTQPGLPMKKGRGATMTHDDKRHGATTLFAALNVLDGTVIADGKPQHRHEEWLEFLRLIDRTTPRGEVLHLICDNYATHKHRNVKTWLKKHPRFHVHFTPTSASWLNMVERFFRSITVDRLRRGVFRSVAELNEAIRGYIAAYNDCPKPFVWTAKANDILEKVMRGRVALAKVVQTA
ncbi:MAG: IS630 family transposase [Luteimonas sp.]